MALTVEDGTGLAAANSYVSLAEALAYHSDRGNDTWAAEASDEVRAAALVRGAAALDGMYGGRWPGFRYTDLQGLDWPRSGAWDRDGYPLTGVPQKVKAAACEAALIEIGSAGALSKKSDTGLAELTVGPITKKWLSGSGVAQTAYPAIKQALARIVRGGGSMTMTRC